LAQNQVIGSNHTGAKQIDADAEAIGKSSFIKVPKIEHMLRRDFLGLAAVGPLIAAETPVDFTLRIQPVTFEFAHGKAFKTIGYNGSVPGPLLRMKEGRPVTIEVFNETGNPELVHWHGLHIPSDVDGAMEEGTPMIPPHANRRYAFTPSPVGTRWYHTHTMAGRDLKRASYTGQFGFLYVEPKSEPGAFDQELFLALKEYDPFMSTGGDDQGSMDAVYHYFAIHAGVDRVRVKRGQRVMLRILNASATAQRRIAFAGHKFRVIALDGNPVPNPQKVDALELAPAERIDATVEMNEPGVWLLGTTTDKDREAGMSLVFEYDGQTGSPRWIPPSTKPWDYTIFGDAAGASQPDARVPLVIEKKFAGHNWVDKWAINGKSFPKTDPIRVKQGGRYRLAFDNRSDEAHPLHLHRHSFELVNVAGVPTSGIYKDVVVVPPKKLVEVDLVANNPGKTLFHCHQQMHMDYGFMCLMEYL
jgi:FtsP/CotA-like multicopper oxidase with cupredoxin domain